MGFYCIFFLPETKGVPIDEIQEGIFMPHWFWGKVRSRSSAHHIIHWHKQTACSRPLLACSRAGAPTTATSPMHTAPLTHNGPTTPPSRFLQVLADARADSRRSSASDGDVKTAVTVTVNDAQRKASQAQKPASQL